MVRVRRSFDDPAHAQGSDPERMQVFRRVRDEIGEPIQEWLRADDHSLVSGSTSLPKGE